MAPLQLDLGILIILKGCHNCQLSIVNCQFGEAAKQQFTAAPGWADGRSVQKQVYNPGIGFVNPLPCEEDTCIRRRDVLQ